MIWMSVDCVGMGEAMCGGRGVEGVWGGGCGGGGGGGEGSVNRWARHLTKHPLNKQIAVQLDYITEMIKKNNIGIKFNETFIHYTWL